MAADLQSLQGQLEGLSTRQAELQSQICQGLDRAIAQEVGRASIAEASGLPAGTPSRAPGR
jgi:hypothetical protein